MRKFELGKRYKETESTVFEIIKRTAKFVTYVEITHEGRFNERRSEPRRTRVYNWEGREVFFSGIYQLEA